MNDFLKKTEDEVTKHVLAIERIAASLHIPREEVQQLYERVLEEMQQKARIKDFLTIFAAKRVEQLLRTMYGTLGTRASTDLSITSA